MLCVRQRWCCFHFFSRPQNCTSSAYPYYMILGQSPKDGVYIYSNETQYWKPGFMNGARHFCRYHHIFIKKFGFFKFSILFWFSDWNLHYMHRTVQQYSLKIPALSLFTFLPETAVYFIWKHTGCFSAVINIFTECLSKFFSFIKALFSGFEAKKQHFFQLL